MRFVITGASGHIGNNLARHLLTAGHEVRAVLHRDLDPPSLAGVDVERVRADVRDAESLETAFRGADAVVHLAARISLRRTGWRAVEAVNVGGVRNVLTACRRAGVGRLVHTSSIHAYDPHPLDEPVDEDRPLGRDPRRAPYDRSKAEGERLVREAIEEGMDAVIVNPTAVIGPHDYEPSHQGSGILLMASGRLPALVPGGFDWVDVRDVAAAIEAAAARAPAGGRYLLPGRWATMVELSEIAARWTGHPATRRTVPMALARIGAPFMNLYAGVTGRRPIYTSMSLQTLEEASDQIRGDGAARDLGHRPRPLEETLGDTLAFFVERGALRPRADAPLAEEGNGDGDGS